MTVHRDIKVLVEEGIVEKTFGGIRLIDSQVQKPNVNECVVCSRTIDHRLYCQLILTNNRVEIACCPHCGIIRHQMLGNEVVEILCCDFFTNITISAIQCMVCNGYIDRFKLLHAASSSLQAKRTCRWFC